jgi:hypothetical protein
LSRFALSSLQVTVFRSSQLHQEWSVVPFLQESNLPAVRLTMVFVTLPLSYPLLQGGGFEPPAHKSGAETGNWPGCILRLKRNNTLKLFGNFNQVLIFAFPALPFPGKIVNPLF